MSQLAFLPWIQLDHDVDLGSYQLLRYRREQLPAENREEQAVIDQVLEPFHGSGIHPIRRATIVTTSTRGLIEDLADEAREDLFYFGDLLAFSGLAGRRYFQHRYWNRDHFRLVLQSFVDPQAGIVLLSRRRDGSTTTLVARSAYRVSCPDHVYPTAVSLDEPLLLSLLESRERDEWNRLRQGIVLFNEANTDRLEMPQASEMILVYSAFEQLLGLAGAGPRDVAVAFASLFDPDAECPRDEWKIAEGNERAAALLDRAGSLREAWLQDLGISRGSLAHGHEGEAYPACWSPREHLLFSSFAFPLAVKRVLAGLQLYDMLDDDERLIEAFEFLLNERHFAEDVRDRGVWGDVLDQRLIRRLVRQVEHGDEDYR